MGALSGRGAGCTLGVAVLGVVLLLQTPVALATPTPIFQDEFDYVGQPDSSRWIINHPGQYWHVQGRTLFPESTTPGAHLPWVDNETCHIEHYRYNALHLGTPKTTFEGGEIHSAGPDGTLTPDMNYRIEARVGNAVYPDGLVTSFFLYGYDGTNSDEVDYEFCSRQTNDDESWPAGGEPLMTNPWNESVQNPEWVHAPTISLTDNEFDTLLILWYPGESVEWWRSKPDDTGWTLLRRETDPAYVPDQAMNVYFNFWAPPANAVWEGRPVGDNDLQPDQTDQSVFWTYEIDYVRIYAAKPGDVNEDGKVDGNDLAHWQVSYDPLGSDNDIYTYMAGDFNGDGKVDGGDLAIWQQNYDPLGDSSPKTSSVPEPATLTLVLSPVAWLIAMRERRRRRKACQGDCGPQRFDD